MKIKRLKISQQLLTVFFTGVLLPMCITGLIITNINQHAVRAELTYSALITADNVYQRLEKSLEEKKLALLYIAKSVDYISLKGKSQDYLKEITDFSDEASYIDIIQNDENINNATKNKLFKNTEVEIFADTKTNSVTMYTKLKNRRYLRKFISISNLEKDLFKYLVNDKRQVYIADSQNNIVMSYNKDKFLFKKLIPSFPKKVLSGDPTTFIYDEEKNEPHVFIKLDKPDWKIIIATPKQLTHYGIIDARIKIVAAMVVTAITIIILGILYSVSVNSNLKQLFKAISAISGGNYRRKVRLVRDFFTPIEFVQLMEKFNDMAQKIDEGYIEIQDANEKLSKLDKLKSNLIDTVSHEFRTPLTCIKGYASSLLRSEKNNADEAKIKSLKVIKQQTERLGRLVDDLLVIPEIESDFLRIFPSEVDIKEVFESCIISTNQKEHREINLEMPENFPYVWADPDRTVQIAMNLIENALKYSSENTPINIEVSQQNDFAVIKVVNICPTIPKERLKKLFDKFERLEDDLKRKTRGTGLGLFIVRGLIHAMGGDIEISSDNNFEVKFTLPVAG
jgi:signal transduction histidine kinase